MFNSIIGKLAASCNNCTNHIKLITFKDKYTNIGGEKELFQHF